MKTITINHENFKKRYISSAQSPKAKNILAVSRLYESYNREPNMVHEHVRNFIDNYDYISTKTWIDKKILDNMEGIYKTFTEKSELETVVYNLFEELDENTLKVEFPSIKKTFFLEDSRETGQIFFDEILSWIYTEEICLDLEETDTIYINGYQQMKYPYYTLEDIFQCFKTFINSDDSIVKKVEKLKNANPDSILNIGKVVKGEYEKLSEKEFLIKKSLEHWEENLAVAIDSYISNDDSLLEKFKIGADHCQLCVKYNTRDGVCKGCPITEKTGGENCYGTPYYRVRDCLQEIKNGDGKKSRMLLIDYTMEEIEFLSSLSKNINPVTDVVASLVLHPALKEYKITLPKEGDRMSIQDLKNKYSSIEWDLNDYDDEEANFSEEEKAEKKSAEYLRILHKVLQVDTERKWIECRRKENIETEKERSFYWRNGKPCIVLEPQGKIYSLINPNNSVCRIVSIIDEYVVNSDSLGVLADYRKAYIISSFLLNRKEDFERIYVSQLIPSAAEAVRDELKVLKIFHDIHSEYQKFSENEFEVKTQKLLQEKFFYLKGNAPDREHYKTLIEIYNDMQNEIWWERNAIIEASKMALLTSLETIMENIHKNSVLVKEKNKDKYIILNLTSNSVLDFIVGSFNKTNSRKVICQHIQEEKKHTELDINGFKKAIDHYFNGIYAVSGQQASYMFQDAKEFFDNYFTKEIEEIIEKETMKKLSLSLYINDNDKYEMKMESNNKIETTEDLNSRDIDSIIKTGLSLFNKNFLSEYGFENWNWSKYAYENGHRIDIVVRKKDFYFHKEHNLKEIDTKEAAINFVLNIIQDTIKNIKTEYKKFKQYNYNYTVQIEN